MNNLNGLGELKITSAAGYNIEEFLLHDMYGRQLKIYLSEDEKECIAVDICYFEEEGLQYTENGKMVVKFDSLNLDLYNAAVEKRKIYKIVEIGKFYIRNYETCEDLDGFEYEREYKGFQFANISYDHKYITYIFAKETE